MSEPWDQLNFEQLLNDDSLMFGADDTSFSNFVDFGAHYSPVPQFWTDLANEDTLPSPKNIVSHPPPLDAWPIAQYPPSASLGGAIDHSVLASAHCMQPVGCPPSASSQAMRSPSLVIPEKAKAHQCIEPFCRARYVRKGDLLRHTREYHGDIEHLCPWAGCLRHRKGHGFKRMHRLVSHLWEPPVMFLGYHPRVRSNQDAKYIAVDYNDSLSTIGQTIFALNNEQKPERGVSAVTGSDQDIGPMSKYTDRLLGVRCPEVGCSTFACEPKSWGADWTLAQHLIKSHKLRREDATEVAEEAVLAHRSEEELERLERKKAT